MTWAIELYHEQLEDLLPIFTAVGAAKYLLSGGGEDMIGIGTIERESKYKFFHRQVDAWIDSVPALSSVPGDGESYSVGVHK